MTDNPIAWGEMTPEEKGALLLAHHEGKLIQVYRSLDEAWESIKSPNWSECHAYRVRPEPKRETVRVSGRVFPNGQWVFGTSCKSDTHCITFDTIDGEPDCSSIRMEKIE